MNTCQNCSRAMVQLFLTQACDYCDYGPKKETLFMGYIAYIKSDESPFEDYVFRTRHDAERWATLSGRLNTEIREVYSTKAFRWHLSQGTAKDLVLADRMYTIYPDHKHEPSNYQAFFYNTEQNNRIVNS
jgi:hypothetical protein